MNIDLNLREIAIIRKGLRELLDPLEGDIEDYRDLVHEYEEINELDSRLCAAKEVDNG